jgi:arylsulfatase A-like enzyme
MPCVPVSGRRTSQAIDRRTFLGLAAAGTAGMALPGCGGLGPRRRPNVLFVFPDQLRANMCSVYGGRNIVTPNIDRLASEGVVFTNSVSTCPLCTPYRGMLQTGRYPTHSGIILNFVEASHAQNPHCLANVFSTSGYQTGYIGKWHLAAGVQKGSRLGADHVACPQADDPDHDFVAPGPRRLGYRHWQAYNFHYSYHDYWWYEDGPEQHYSGRYEADTETDQAITFMEKCRQADRPFLVNVAPHPPHPPFSSWYTPEGSLERVPQTVWWPPNAPGNDPAADEELRCYLAMIQNADDNLGRLLDYLDWSGLAEDTIVVFTSDHGEMLGSHGRIQKMVPYAEAVNIPLIMRWPRRIAPGIRVDALQTPMDHLPTLCGLAGLPIPGEVDGADLSGIVTGRDRDTRDGVLMAQYSSGELWFQTGTSWPEWRAVRTKQHTYIRWLAGTEELYDNSADPYQMVNLVESDAAPEALARLRSRLADLLAAAHDDFRPGTGYSDWYDDCRNLVRTALGPVPG